MKIDEISEALKSAKSNPKDFFGLDPEETLKKWHVLCHPDRFTDKELAHKLFTEFTLAYEKIKVKPITFKLKGEDYTITTSPIVGDTADVYLEKNIVKIGRFNSVSVEFAKNEIKCLEALKHKHFSKYLPELILNDKQISVFKSREKFTRLSELGKIHPRHLGWIGNRLLEIIGFAHEMKITHGGIVPDNILIFKKNHGINLIDWKFGGKPKIKKSKKFSDLYPKDDTVSNATDIYMIFKTLETLCDDMPHQMKAFFRGCTIERASMRPNNAWLLMDEYQVLLKKLFGPPEFIVLE